MTDATVNSPSSDLTSGNVRFDSAAYLKKDLLRFLTCGSVDDGKSTLIGRLLYDSKSIFEDQLNAIESTSQRRGDERVNLALLTDGLRAEREQGITIDVAYRYFTTPQRKFIVADTPGHVQYTRNMVTGASTAEVALLLVDARQGVIEQTRRHAYLAALLRIPHAIVCVNKMDLVDFEQGRYDEICSEFQSFAAPLGFETLTCVPLAALAGDNVVERSTQMDWYSGDPLLHILETLPVGGERRFDRLRLPVQWVIRPQSDRFHDYRGYAGAIAAGEVGVGDEVVVMPSGLRSVVTGVHLGEVALEKAVAPQSVTLTLRDDIDIGRGDIIVHPGQEPRVGQELEATVVWMNEKPLQLRRRYALKHNSREVKAMVTAVDFRLDVSDLQRHPTSQLGLNEIGRVQLKTTSPLCWDPYSACRTTGSFILVDEATNETLAAGMLLDPVA